MRPIPCDERSVADKDVFSAFDLSYPGLEQVREALEAGDDGGAKRALVRYFETRTNVRYYYDYRQLPLKPVDTDASPYLFQSSMGLSGSLKDFCLFAGRKMLRHIYVRPGRERKELDLGADYGNLPHFNWFEDQGKVHRSVLDNFVRGIFMEYLSILYHETGEREIVDYAEEFLKVFWEHYPLIVACTEPDASHFSLIEERDVMSAGWLALNYVTLLYTRLPYESGTETAFEIIKHMWFLGMQFRRFDTDTYRKYNHHLWERGLVPFFLGTLFPEIPDFAGMKERGAEVTRQHILDDFNEDGGYNEHSIPYWSGAALSDMICRGMYLARLNGERLADGEAAGRLDRSFDVLAMISAPGDFYPSVGDNGGTQVDYVLCAGAGAGNRMCGALTEYRREEGRPEPDIPRDYCNERVGFFSSKSSLRRDANHILMSAKVKCGNTGHNHMDLLSVFVSIHGQEFIGEPYARALYHAVPVGTALRGYMYNMTSHNTVLAFGEPVQPDCAYAAKWGVLRPDTPVETFVTEEEGCYVKAYHDAYTHSRHVRKILSCRGRGFLIRDELIGGNRMDKESIQRWYLFPDAVCEQIDGRTLLLEKNGAKALLMWSGAPRLKLWRKEELYPSIVKDTAEIGLTADACFKPENFTAAGGIGALAQSLLILDATEEIPAIEDRDGFCDALMKDAEEGRLSEALTRFGRLG